MLTPQEITLHLQECLPLFTDRFHDELPVTSGSVLNGILTITLPTGHSITANDEIFINEALIRNRITEVIQNSDDTISYITENAHDLTAYASEGHQNTWPEGLSVLVELPTGNETIVLVPDASGIPHSNEFVGIEGSIEPVITGEEYLLENRAYGIGGLKVISSVTPTTLVIDLSDVPDVPDGDIIIDKIITNIRVTAVADLERAKQMYEDDGSNKAWLFVVMQTRRPSKDRANNDDLTSLPGSSLKLLNIIQNFSTLVIIPSSNNLSGIDAKTFAYVDLFVILNSCLYGWNSTGYEGDGQADYNTASYYHAFEWQTRQIINWEDGYINNKTVALRNLAFTQTVLEKGVSSASIEFGE